MRQGFYRGFWDRPKVAGKTFIISDESNRWVCHITDRKESLKDDDPWTFSGTWSLKDKIVVESILAGLNVKFHVTESPEDEKLLQNWSAWDPEAENPNVGYGVWVHNDDIRKIGNELLDRFPEKYK